MPIKRRNAVYIPDGFYDKEKNEPFVLNIMSKVFPNVKWENGNANNKEPDYISNELPFEITLASNNKKNNFIQRRKNLNYQTEDAEQDLIDYIYNSINKKSKKNYSIENINLCILLAIPCYNWVDNYNRHSYFRELLIWRRDNFFNLIRTEYIEKNFFKEIFIILPNINKNWSLIEVSTNKQHIIEFTDEELESGKYPFFIQTQIEITS